MKILVFQPDQDAARGLEIVERLKSQGVTAIDANGKYKADTWRALIELFKTNRSFDGLVIGVSSKSVVRSDYSVKKEISAIADLMPGMPVFAYTDTIYEATSYNLARSGITHVTYRGENPQTLPEIIRQRIASDRKAGFVKKPAAWMEIGPLHINLTNKKVTIPGNNSVRVTAYDQKLLVFFAQNLGDILRTRDIISELHGDHHAGHPRSLHTFISKMRLRLNAIDPQQHPTLGDIIETVRDEGFRMNAPDVSQKQEKEIVTAPAAREVVRRHPRPSKPVYAPALPQPIAAAAE